MQTQSRITYTKEVAHLKLNDYLLVFPSLIGAVFVALGNPLYANLCWMIGNPILIIKNHKQGDKGQRLYFSICSIIAAYGVYNLI